MYWQIEPLYHNAKEAIVVIPRPMRKNVIARDGREGNDMRMYWNWVRWQCLNKRDFNDGEIPKGTMIDEDEFVLQVLKQLKPRKGA